MVSFAGKLRLPWPVVVSTIGLFVLMFPCILPAQPPPVPEGTTCSECGMKVDQNSRFVSEAFTTDEKRLFFCDIGDMLFHFRAKKEKIKNVYVRNYVTGTWIDGRKSFYVLNKKIPTPMSWGIAAFSEESAAREWGSPVDFDGAFTLLK